MTRARDVGRHAKRVQRELRALEAPASIAGTLESMYGDPSRLSIIDVMQDPQLFGKLFVGPSWATWRVFLKALFGLALAGEELETFRRLTGRAAAPTGPAREGWVVVGRRGGKSRIAALVAVYLAVFRNYVGLLATGERGTVMILAADRRQARTVFRYVLGLLRSVPALERMIKTPPRVESVDLVNGVTIEVHTASFKSVRGYTLIACIGDEIAFWQTDDSANPDSEVVGALRPAMSTIPGAVLLGISTPYRMGGELFKNWQKHWARDGDGVLVWQAGTRDMNPMVPASVIALAYEEDAVAAATEYGGQFRTDVERFLPAEVITRATVPQRYELPPIPGMGYVAFTDPSGGSQDSFTLAIAHVEGDTGVLDVLRETRPPFSPEDVVASYVRLLSDYGVAAVSGDRYGGNWPPDLFLRHGIVYVPAELVKSELYRQFLPRLMSGRVELLDHRVLSAQLGALERRTTRAGKDSIDHPPGGRDDVANVVAGVMALALPVGQRTEVSEIVWDPTGMFDGAEQGGSWLPGMR